MDAVGIARDLLRTAVSMACGWHTQARPLLGRWVDVAAIESAPGAAASALAWLAGDGRIAPPSGELRADMEEATGVFCDYYGRDGGRKDLAAMRDELATAADDEGRARAVARIFLPELRMGDDEILARWGLSDMEPNPEPIRPEEVVIQLNALYTVPDRVPARLRKNLREAGQQMMRDPGRCIADYDHPVALFDSEESHELVRFLDEFDRDVAFEKERGVLAGDHRVPVLISVSVTHEGLERPAGEWVRGILAAKNFRHVRCLLVTEAEARRIRHELLRWDSEIFTVSGRYGAHFTALKYAQLILEKAYGLRAGFKLDTDEGIRSSDLWAATGRTWFQTLCHPYWGGRARDWRGNECLLGVNEGEYVNWCDIERLGYAAAMRVPDVTPPASHLGPDVFFNKAFVHGRATALYNRFLRIEDGVSHPVVKGGGFGITNGALRQAAPFTFSRVGRAEDQQFYFSGMPGGCRAIFHPDLRIAHYKSKGGAVAKAEEKTVATRLAGDLYRLVIFQEIVARFGVKDDIDPMPGAFAGPLARAQATLLLLSRAHEAASRGAMAMAGHLMEVTLPELRALKRSIDRGEVAAGLARERDGWREFIARADALDPAVARRFCETHLEVKMSEIA